MKQKLLQSLMLIAVLLTSTHAHAHDFEAQNSDGVTIYYNIISSTNKTCQVTFQGSSYDSYSNEYTGSIIIPETVTYNGTTYSVTSIGDSAFRGCSGLTSVIIPNSVTSIGESAFWGCTGLASVTIPNSVTGISFNAFGNCSNLTNITIPSSVTWISNSSFTGCSGLASIVVESGNAEYDSRDNCNAIIHTSTNTLYAGCKNTTIPNSVTSINHNAFSGCSGLTSVIIPNSVTSIGDSAFEDCTGLNSITIPNSVISIGNWAFYNCSELTSVIIGNSVTSIGWLAFSGCTGLNSITIPNSVTSINQQAFSSCTALKELQIEDGETPLSFADGTVFSSTPLESLYLGRDLSISIFSNITSLKEVTIGNSVTSIGNRAFYGCIGLSSLTIGNRVTSISTFAFEGCTGLTTIKVETGNSKYDSRNNCNAIIHTSTNTLYAGCKNTTIPNSVTSIGSYAFYSCSGLTSITIPNSVTSIGNYAFSGCTGLTSITIPNSVTSIGNEAFINCTGLTNITIPNSVASIGNYAFYNCIALRELRIEDGEMTLSLGYNSYKSSGIGEGLFYDCPLETLYLGRNIKYTDYNTSNTYSEYPERYGYSAFYNIKTLKSVTISNSVANIDNYVFNNCIALKELRIEDGENPLSFATGSCFSSSPLESLYLGRNLSYNSSSSSPFYNKNSLNTVIIGNSVTRISNYAFWGCTGLTSITIPNSVTSIGDSAFAGCSGLTGVTIPDGVTSIGDSAFRGCSGLTGVTIPDGVTSIGSSAFRYCSGLTSVTIPNSVTSIGDYAFEYCSGLTSVTIGNSVTSIGSSAFAVCTGLTSITIPNSITSIRGGAFEGCTNLNYLVFNAENCTEMGTNFTGCKKLARLTIGKNVKIIPDYAFNDCTSLKELIIEGGETTLSLGCDSYSTSGTGQGLFYDCPLQTLYLGRNLSYNTGKKYGYSPFYNNSSLKTVTIGKNVTSIGSWAFSGCTSLTSITIPNSITSIGSEAFENCSGLTSVNISDLEAWCKIDFGDYDANPLYYAKKLYLNGELLTGLIIPDSIKKIKNYAFRGCTSLTSITIPNSVTSIGDNAFAGCSGLTGVTIPDGVTSIGVAAFYGCSGLSSITIPNSVTSIGSDAFYGCTGLCGIKRNATATTQTKLNFDITNNTEYEFYIKVNNKTYSSNDKTIEIPELAPYSNPSIDYGLRINDIFCKIYSESKFYTKSLNKKLETENGDFYIKAKGSYEEGDATILGTMLSFQKEPTEYDNQNEKTFNLDPNKSYTVYYSVNTKEGGVYSTSKTFTTGALTWSDEEYQATSTTSARLMTATNCDATEGTGFEWRRYGAPENLKPNAVACPVIDGMLIGSLRNLNSEAYYEFRPYYTSSLGNTHYGEWTALFTGDANVYFEPEVRTYEDVMVATNNATLKGYALAGTDDIISQGFEYWESSVQPGTANSLTASVNSKKIEVSGISMTTTISDLKYGTTYCYRAFATTASGTIYGETVEFTTEKDLSGIENVIVEEDETVEYYNLQGVKIVNPSSGLYIKRQGNKVTKVTFYLWKNLTNEGK